MVMKNYCVVSLKPFWMSFHIGFEKSIKADRKELGELSTRLPYAQGNPENLWCPRSDDCLREIESLEDEQYSSNAPPLLTKLRALLEQLALELRNYVADRARH